MTIFILLAILTVALVATLERTHRRHNDPWSSPTASQPGSDRDWVRTKLDLLAASGDAVPFTHKPVAVDRPGQTLTPRPTPRRRTPRRSQHSGPRAA